MKHNRAEDVNIVVKNVIENDKYDISEEDVRRSIDKAYTLTEEDLTL